MVGGALWRSGAVALAAVMALCGCEALLGLNDLADRTGGPSDGGLDATEPAPDVLDATASDSADADAALWPQPDAEAAPREATPREATIDAPADAQVETQALALPDADAEPRPEPDAAVEDVAEAQAPIPEWPAVFVLTGSTPTPTRGGAQTPTADLCPGDQVVVGYSGTLATSPFAPCAFLASSLQLLCGAIDVVGFAPSMLSILPGATLAVQGTPGGSPFTATCPGGQVAVGIHGRAGVAVDQVGFDCAPLTLASDGSVGVDTSAITSLPAYGGAGGGPFDDTCAAGQVVRGVDVAAEAWLTNVNAVCATPSAPACVGDLSGVSTGSFRISFTLKTTQAGLVALLNQRAACTLASFWDIRLFKGGLFVETDDSQAYTTITASNLGINDGLPHEVVVERLAGNLLVLVDDVQVGSNASAANFAGLPPLVVGTDACDSTDGTIPLVGSLTNLCVAAP